MIHSSHNKHNPHNCFKFLITDINGQMATLASYFGLGQQKHRYTFLTSIYEFNFNTLIRNHDMIFEVITMKVNNFYVTTIE